MHMNIKQGNDWSHKRSLKHKVLDTCYPSLWHNPQRADYKTLDGNSVKQELLGVYTTVSTSLQETQLNNPPPD